MYQKTQKHYPQPAPNPIPMTRPPGWEGNMIPTPWHQVPMGGGVLDPAMLLAALQGAQQGGFQSIDPGFHPGIDGGAHYLPPGFPGTGGPGPWAGGGIGQIPPGIKNHRPDRPGPHLPPGSGSNWLTTHPEALQRIQQFIQMIQSQGGGGPLAMLLSRLGGQ